MDNNNKNHKNTQARNQANKQKIRQTNMTKKRKESHRGILTLKKHRSNTL